MVYIVIVTYNGLKWLDKCLSSINYDSYKVIIIDNASSDDTVSFIETKYRVVKLFKQSVNLGFGQANNIGIQYALDQGAEHVFLLNQDAYLKDDCINNLLRVHQNNLSYGILSPVHFDGEGSNLDSNFSMYLNRYKTYEAILFDIFTEGLRACYPIEFVNAAGWLISRDCLEKVGGFDPLFFHYGEDRNYCQRVYFHGFKIGIVPAASIFHDRANRVKTKIEIYSEAYYQEFERYLKVDWANINITDFERNYDARMQYLLSKQRKFLIKLQIKKYKDCKIKRKIMLQLKSEILKSRKIFAKSQTIHP